MATVHVNGLTQLRRSLKQAGPEATRELRLGLKAGAEVIAAKARQDAPVGTDRPKPPEGTHLRDTIKAGTAGAYARVYSRAVYANAIHWGWRAHNITADPFIEKAADESVDEVDAVIAKRLDALLTRLGL